MALNIERHLRNLPLALIAFRFVLAIVCIVLGVAGRSFAISGWVFVAILSTGLLSDIFDGVVARRVGVVSATLRRLDSQTDMIFWLSAALAALLLHPDIVRTYAPGFLLLVGLEIACYGVSLLRFGRETCTHAYSAKLYGVTLLIGMCALLGFAEGGLPLWLMFVAGTLSGIDVILIVLLLPDWNYDVPSSYHAFRLRRVHRRGHAAGG